ncbi:MAG: hypothetical protein IH881_18735 [Myxococcales bacterium]|nr:hypothetical protein [Myxococcales bacterium]
MNKALALSAFALIMALPLVSSGSSITNTFLSSSSASGTASDLVAGNTIQFEVTLQLNDGQIYTTVLFTLSGDTLNPDVVDGSATLGNGWGSAVHNVTGWVWHYGNNDKVDLGMDGRESVVNGALGDNVAGLFGAFGIETKAGDPRIGDGLASMVGTVTITINAIGTFKGGAYLHPTLGFFGNGTTEDIVTVSGGDYIVFPEPGTAVLMMLGLIGLGVNGRSHRK